MPNHRTPSAAAMKLVINLKRNYSGLADCDPDILAYFVDSAFAEERAKLIEALKPFARFAKMYEAKPLSGMGDAIYAIHTGTEWEAEIKRSDCAIALALLRSAGEAV